MSKNSKKYDENVLNQIAVALQGGPSIVSGKAAITRAVPAPATPVNDSAVTKVTTLPWGWNSNGNFFPFRKSSFGGDKGFKDRSFALLVTWREYISNFHSYKRFTAKEDNQIFVGTMQIGDDIYCVGFHNGIPFHDRNTLVEKGLTANQSGASGVSLQGKGLKLPQAYLTADRTQKLVICSKDSNRSNNQFMAGVSEYKSSEVHIESNLGVDKEWYEILVARLGKKMFDSFTVFYLTKISPFFKLESNHCSMSRLFQNLPDLVGAMTEDLSIHVGESCLPLNRTLSDPDLPDSYSYETLSLNQMHETYRSRVDDGSVSHEDSEFVSNLHHVEYDGAGIKCVLGIRVRISTMAGVYPDSKINKLIDETDDGGRDWDAHIRTVSEGSRVRGNKGKGNRTGAHLALQGFLRVPVIYTQMGSEQYKRFETQPIGFMRQDECRELHSALRLPVYDGIKPTLKTKSGNLVVFRKPYLKIAVDIEDVTDIIDTDAQTTGDSLTLLGHLNVRGDFLMHHTDAKYKNMKDEIMRLACEAVSSEITKDHWLYQWCEERFEPIEHDLYERDIFEGGAGQKKDKRIIKKFDIDNLVGDYEIHMSSESEKFVAFFDQGANKFINNNVDTSNHSKGCYTYKIEKEFLQYLDDRLAERLSNITTGSPTIKKKARQEAQDEHTRLVSSYNGFCNQKNGGQPVQIYMVRIDPIGILDPKGNPVPFYTINRDTVV